MFKINYTIQNEAPTPTLDPRKEPEENYWLIASVKEAVQLYIPQEYSLHLHTAEQTTELHHHNIPLGQLYGEMKQVLHQLRSQNTASIYGSVGYQLPFYDWKFTLQPASQQVEVVFAHGQHDAASTQVSLRQVAVTLFDYLEKAAQKAVAHFPHQFGQSENPPPYYDAGYVERLQQEGRVPNEPEDYAYFVEEAIQDYQVTQQWFQETRAWMEQLPA